jgi:hypothetical protein
MYSKNIITPIEPRKSNDIFTKLKSHMLTLENMNRIILSSKKQPSFMPKARAPPVEQKPLVEAKQPFKAKQMFEAKQPFEAKQMFKAKQPFERKPKVEEETKLLQIESKKEIPKKIANPFFSPRQKDSLFWCFFIIKNGFSAYEYPGTTTFAKEKELKFEYIELLRKSKQTLKVKKIKNLREDVEDELANKDRIGMKTFIALCISTNINVLFIHKKKCFELILVEDEPIYVVHQKEENGHTKYYYEEGSTKETIDLYRKTYFSWDNVDKPLKAPSAYKLDDLQNLCTKVGIVIQTYDKKKTKKELYDLLLLTI